MGTKRLKESAFARAEAKEEDSYGTKKKKRQSSQKGRGKH